MSKQITILGAGLVGSLLAVLLAKRDHTVTIYERRADMRKEKIQAGRSINLALSDRGWKALRAAGLEEEIRKIAIPMHSRMIHAVDGTQNEQPYGKEGQAIYSVSRGALNMALMDLAEKQTGVNIHFNQRADTIDLEKPEVKFDAHSVIPYAESNLIFGADGAYSSLRHTMQFLDRFNLSQSYIEHGYKELTIPAAKDGSHLLYKNALHIWPRKNFMLIALPNLDGSFTCTLFFQFDGPVSFSEIKTEQDTENFFREYFADVIPLMPTYKEDFKNNPTSSIVTVRCFPWTYQDKACLIGDAAHAIVPFFGQGMNCGFEDCTILNGLMEKYSDDWTKIFPAFEQSRKPNADAIAELALNNFIEMRDLVADPHFLHKKKMEKLIASAYPDRFISPYQMVSFSNIPYAEALRNGKAINEVTEKMTMIENVEEKIQTSEIVQLIHPILFG
ncbi:MAG: FAD-dependent monooxygenase [Chitinophagaceae bacterium]|nr:FAD-dependent monooxygenase [Chitinophagaceae bacterium]